LLNRALTSSSLADLSTRAKNSCSSSSSSTHRSCQQVHQRSTQAGTVHRSEPHARDQALFWLPPIQPTELCASRVPSLLQQTSFCVTCGTHPPSAHLVVAGLPVPEITGAATSTPPTQPLTMRFSALFPSTGSLLLLGWACAADQVTLLPAVAELPPGCSVTEASIADHGSSKSGERAHGAWSRPCLELQ
jgi:hypothetical protein